MSIRHFILVTVAGLLIIGPLIGLIVGSLGYLIEMAFGSVFTIGFVGWFKNRSILGYRLGY